MIWHLSNRLEIGVCEGWSMVAFQVQPLIPGRLFDLGSGCGTVQGFGSSRRDHPSNFTSAGSFLGFVAEGVSADRDLERQQCLASGVLLHRKGALHHMGRHWLRYRNPGSRHSRSFRYSARGTGVLQAVEALSYNSSKRARRSLLECSLYFRRRRVRTALFRHARCGPRGRGRGGM